MSERHAYHTWYDVRLMNVLRSVMAALVFGWSWPSEAGEPSVVAVFDVEYAGVKLDKATRESLSEYLFSKVASLGAFTLVPRAEVKKRLTSQKKESYRACYDQSCQIEIGKELAAQKSLSTKVLKIGKQCMVTMAVFDLRTAATDGAADATGGCSAGELVRTIEAAAIKLRPAGATIAVAAAVAPPMGEVDEKWCPKAGTRRMGKPYPDGQSVYCIDASGKMQGEMTAWHTTGKVSMKVEYKDSEIDGPHSIFHTNGALFQQGKNEKGKKTGTWISYYDDGVKMEEGAYVNGAKSGKWISYNRDGKKSEEAEYKNDQKNGTYTSYHANGATHETGRYVDDKKEGLWTELRQDGTKEEETNYKEGKRHGESAELDSEGRKIKSITWKLDKRSGPYREWRIDRGQARLELEGTYEDNERDGTFTRFDADGKANDVTAYKNGKRHGPYVRYSGQGEKRHKWEEGQHDNDQKVGVWRRYSEDGQVTLEETYAKNKLNGRMTSWGKAIRDGKRFKTEEGEYLDGEKHGRWLYFDPDGKVVREERYDQGRKVSDDAKR
jgi:antitoxin component YwqK of YwqJK toxin-antitoxin module